MNDDITTIEEAFDSVPPEVQEYIYSDDFSKKISELFTSIMIPGDKQTVLKGVIFGFIAQINDEQEVNDVINSVTQNEADRVKIKEWIDTYVSQKILLLITKAYAEEEDEDAPIVDAASVPPLATPTPVTQSPLSQLASGLKQASSSTAARTDYSNEGSIPANLPVTEAVESVPHTIDPYHEPIEK